VQDAGSARGQLPLVQFVLILDIRDRIHLRQMRMQLQGEMVR
jgi:hypothetical protein